MTGFTTRLSAASRSAPATIRIDHDALPDGNMLAIAQFAPWRVPFNERSSIKGVSAASTTSVMDGIREPRSSASDPLNFAPTARCWSSRTLGSGTPFGQSMACIPVA
ncbi:hypothetical protein D3C81_1434300 [compost metagenome]